jgi:hypothetical protein
MKTYGGVEVQFHVFLIWALVGGEWSGPCSRLSTARGKFPATHFRVGWVGPTVSLDAVARRKNYFPTPFRESNPGRLSVRRVVTMPTKLPRIYGKLYYNIIYFTILHPLTMLQPNYLCSCHFLQFTLPIKNPQQDRIWSRFATSWPYM